MLAGKPCFSKLIPALMIQGETIEQFTRQPLKAASEIPYQPSCTPTPPHLTQAVGEVISNGQQK